MLASNVIRATRTEVSPVLINYLSILCPKIKSTFQYSMIWCFMFEDENNRLYGQKIREKTFVLFQLYCCYNMFFLYIITRTSIFLKTYILKNFSEFSSCTKALFLFFFSVSECIENLRCPQFSLYDLRLFWN